MLDYNKKIKISTKLINGYQYFCDLFCPLSNVNGYVYYHRYVASQKIGRWLTPEEHVHHIDGNKLNNDPDNLMILSSSEHSILENLQRYGEREIKYCIICGKIISKKSKNLLCRDCYYSINLTIKALHDGKKYQKNRIRDYYFLGLTCSICGKVVCNSNESGLCEDCSNKLQRRFDPSKDELEKLVWEIPTTKVAEKYGVSDKAIDKRCKLLGIPKPPRGYWAKKYAGML